MTNLLPVEKKVLARASGQNGVIVGKLKECLGEALRK